MFITDENNVVKNLSFLNRIEELIKLVNDDYDYYFTDQFNKYINEKMYTILLNWICIVHIKYKMSHETLYLTHQVISRYLTMEPDIKRQQLQLVGIASFYMCSKYEDVTPPDIKDMVYIYF